MDSERPLRGLVRIRAGVAQQVEQLPCKQQVAGSSPTASSMKRRVSLVGEEKESEGFPSGQREQTVNLPAYAFGGSNPPPSTKLHLVDKKNAGIAQLVERQPSKLNVAGSNPVSRSTT